jgi:uncharacterized protein (TIGR00369 family)
MPDASVATIEALIDTHFPEIHHGGRTLYIDRLTQDGAVVRLKSHPRNLRPGGTVSGPAMFTLADYGVYVAILARFGEPGLQAVTSTITLNFLARPQPGDILAEIRILRAGRRLIVTQIEMFGEGRPELLAQATATYVMPSAAPRDRR